MDEPRRKHSKMRIGPERAVKTDIEEEPSKLYAFKPKIFMADLGSISCYIAVLFVGIGT